MKPRPILCYAMEKEARPILSRVEVLSKERMGQAIICDCRHGEIEFIVLITGMGKVAAGSSLAAALCKKEVTHVFNIGVGGSIDAQKAPIKTAVIGSRYVQHDMDTSPIGDPVGFISGIDIIYLPSDPKGIELLEKSCGKFSVKYALGTIASGDIFVDSNDQRERIKSLFDGVSCDMETAAFAQVAYAFGVPFNGLRMISDAENAGEYEKNLPYCNELAADIALELLSY